MIIMIHLDSAISAKNEELEKLSADIGEILKEEKFSPEFILNVQLALEEIIVNIARHGYCKEAGLIGIRFETSPEGMSIEISDSAPKFNPLMMPEPDVEADLDEREIGGLGIFLVRKVMDSVSYRYENQKNILLLKKAKNI